MGIREGLRPVLGHERQCRLEALLGTVEAGGAAERRAGNMRLDLPEQMPGLRSLANRMRPMCRLPSSTA